MAVLPIFSGGESAPGTMLVEGRGAGTDVGDAAGGSSVQPSHPPTSVSILLQNGGFVNAGDMAGVV